jgi:hypothetical protein
LIVAAETLAAATTQNAATPTAKKIGLHRFTVQILEKYACDPMVVDLSKLSTFGASF